MIAPAVRLPVFACTLGLLSALSVAADDAKPDDTAVDLKVGAAAPAFETRDDAGKVWRSADHYGKKSVVVYFYPGDFTPGCTAQAKAFKDAMAKLVEKGVEVVGVSGDSVETHARFKKAQALNFTLLADEGGAIARKFGVPFGDGATVRAKDAGGQPFEFSRAGTAGRWTFVIGKDGTVAYKNSKVVPTKDAKAIAEFVATAEGK